VNDWLLRQVCKLAAELADELPSDTNGVLIDVELRVLIDEPSLSQGPSSVTEHVRRVRSNFGEWNGTDRITKERFGW
jgi:hypothetical protein